MKGHPAAFVLAAAAVIGVVGIVIQVLLTRELLVVFQGNEFTIGIVMANWLLLEAAGALSARFGRSSRTHQWFLLALALSVLSLPLSLYLARSLRWFLGVGPALSLDLGQMAVGSFLALAPACITHGACFTFACRAYNRLAAGGKELAGRVYVWETVGTLVGAVLLTGVLALRWPAFTITAWLAATAAAAVVLAAFALVSTGLRRRWLAVGLVLLLMAVAAVPGSWVARLQEQTLALHWQGRDVLFHEDSYYGSITAMETREQQMIYYDGSPSLIIPDPDLERLETTAHVSLLFHQEPRDILLVSGGAGGLLQEIQKHPMDTLDYVELDPALLTAAARLDAPLVRQELDDPRLRTIPKDGRLFVSSTDRVYDAVILHVGEPSTLQTNRLYTQEFFSQIKERLRPGGLLALTLPGSSSHLGHELLRLNRSMYRTLDSVFSHVRILPGDINVYLASSDHGLHGVGPDEMTARLRERDLETVLVTESYLDYRLDDDRWSRFQDKISDVSGIRANTDFNPAAVYYTLGHWGAMFSPQLQRIMSALDAMGMYQWLAVFSFLLAAAVLWLWVQRRGGQPKGVQHWTIYGAVACALITTGMAGMVLDLMILFAFQSLHGYVYQAMALLIALFMAGAAVGAWWSGRTAEGKQTIGRLAAVDVLLVAMLAVLPQYLRLAAASPVFFMAASVAAGALTGAQFPFAASCLHASGRPSAGGLAYGLDLAGGWAGALISAVFLVPLLGIAHTAWVIAGVKVLSSLLLIGAAVSTAGHFSKGTIR